MTYKNFFFTNMRMTIIYMIMGYVFFFGGTTLIEKGELQWMAVGASVLFLVMSLFHITREYNKDYDKIRQL